MDLIIDIGNTRVKVATFVKGVLQEKVYCAETELQSLLLGRFFLAEKTLLSSVKKVPEDLKSFLKDNFKSVFILSSEMKMPFENAYKTPKTVGADRLALVAGAMHAFPKTPVLIIDAGTCVTFDFIDEKGVYHGGAISPGLRMRLKALNEFTGKLPLIDLGEAEELIGTSTKASILSGVVNGTLKEIDGIIEAYLLRYPDTKIVLTGGDAAFFDKKLKNSIFADADILLKGMHFILETTC